MNEAIAILSAQLKIIGMLFSRNPIVSFKPPAARVASSYRAKALCSVYSVMME